ncbi:hypothetical protein FNJ47_48775, partial [Bradyrhizobium sp. UFLA 03-164]|nr:hypothetical protein [Bradyrhizobium uaiense]
AHLGDRVGDVDHGRRDTSEQQLPGFGQRYAAGGAVHQADAEPSGRLRINAPPPAVDLVLAPMIAPFLGRYPQVDLDVVAES